MSFIDDEGPMLLGNLKPDVREKVKDCNTPEEMLALAKEEGIELTDEDLDMVSGGWGSDDSGSGGGVQCIACGSTNTSGHSVRADTRYVEEFVCHDCGESWEVVY